MIGLATSDPAHLWDTLGPQYAALQAAALTAAGVHDWLRRWSDLERIVWEVRAGLKRDRLRDVRDAAADAAYQTFVAGVFGPFQIATQALIAKLLAVPDYTPGPEQTQFVRVWRNEADLFHAANVALKAEIDGLADGYGQRVWAFNLAVDGASLTVPQAEARQTDPDRERREVAWRAIHQHWLGEREPLDRLFLDLVHKRQHLAQQAGLPDYRAYRWREMNRLDFTPHDCLALHDAVAAEITPLTGPLLAARQAALGLDTLRPWDVRADPQRAPAWQPFADVAGLVATTGAICDTLDPDLGALFRRMQAGFLDPDDRLGKPSGGEEWFFSVQRMPYVRVSGTGAPGDLALLLHEMGHAFHDYLSGTQQELTWNQGGPSGFDEFPSTALSYLGVPMLAQVSDHPAAAAAAAHAMREMLTETVLRWLPQVLMNDAFQHWVYAQDPATLRPADLDAAWVALWPRFLPGVDWRGLAAEQAVGWQRQGILFNYPFYAIDYALAHLGAIQLWQHAQADPAATWHAYRATLAAGYTLPIPAAYAAAGVALPFSRAVVGEVAAFLARQFAASDGQPR